MFERLTHVLQVGHWSLNAAQTSRCRPGSVIPTPHIGHFSSLKLAFSSSDNVLFPWMVLMCLFNIFIVVKLFEQSAHFAFFAFSSRTAFSPSPWSSPLSKWSSPPSASWHSSPPPQWSFSSNSSPPSLAPPPSSTWSRLFTLIRPLSSSLFHFSAALIGISCSSSSSSYSRQRGHWSWKLALLVKFSNQALCAALAFPYVITFCPPEAAWTEKFLIKVLKNSFDNDWVDKLIFLWCAKLCTATERSFSLSFFIGFMDLSGVFHCLKNFFTLGVLINWYDDSCTFPFFGDLNMFTKNFLTISFFFVFSFRFLFFFDLTSCSSASSCSSCSFNSPTSSSSITKLSIPISKEVSGCGEATTGTGSNSIL